MHLLLRRCCAGVSSPVRVATASAAFSTTTAVSKHRGLQFHEKLSFEQDNPGLSGVDFPAFKDAGTARLGAAARGTTPIGLPNMAESTVMRHYVRLSQKNFAIDSGFYPLGSCTMKYNPRINELAARLPGVADVHPLQPQSTAQGAYEVMTQLSDWLLKITGMKAVALSPAAGAHGELCGIMAINQALRATGQTHRRIVLVPQNAHGTNPATAALCGFEIDEVPQKDDGRVDVDGLKRVLAEKGPNVAAAMLTNPNTHGLFEKDIVQISKALHDVGAYFYCDGANFNALLSRVLVSDLGVDCMHINLHKTFSTPHGGGGPGSGPVVLAESLAKYAPLPYVVRGADGKMQLVEFEAPAGPNDPRGIPQGLTASSGALRAWTGQMGMWIRALAYAKAYGVDGLRAVSGDAVLNANYILACLRDTMTVPFDIKRCMHEALFNDSFLNGTHVSTLDFAKALIDNGFHPPTMYWPLTVRGALLIEPTETESKETLDEFVNTVKALVERAKKGDSEFFKGAPHNAPIRRADEVLAAKKPRVRYSATA